MFYRFGQSSKSLVLVVQYLKHATPVVLARNFTKILVKINCKNINLYVGCTISVWAGHQLACFRHMLQNLSAKYPYHRTVTPWIMDDRNFMNNNNLFD